MDSAKGQPPKTTAYNRKKTTPEYTNSQGIIAELKASLKRLQDLVENVDDVIVEIDSVGRVLYVTPNVERFSGYRPEELMGKIPTEFMPPEKAVEIYKYFLELASRGEKLEALELTGVHKNGHLFIMEAYAVPYFDGIGKTLGYNGIGKTLGYRGVARDITNRKQLEEALRESEERFRAAFDKGAVPMAMTALDNRLIRVNAAFSKMVGFSESELAGMNFYNITHPDDIAAKEAGLVPVRSGEKDSFRMEKRYIRKDGQIVWVDMSTASVRDIDGKPLYIVTHAQDITERKQMEEALRKSKDELEIKVQERTGQLLEANKIIRQSEEKYRELVESAQSIILRMDCEGNITFFNEFAEKFFRYSRQEILGRNVVGTIVSETQSSGRHLKTLMNNIAHNPEKYTNNENENIRKNGERVWISWTNAPVRDAQGKLLEVLCVGNDITERKRMEGRLRSAQSKLRAMASEIVFADERSRQHLATELHDTVLQTLGAAKMRSELLYKYLPEEGVGYYTELQNMLLQSITQARSIMSEMSPPILYELGFVPAIEWLSEQIQSQHDLEISCQANDSFKPLTHEVQIVLFQATRELLLNVVKHAKAKKVVVSITEDQKKARITIIDDGIGFDGKISFRADASGGFGLFSIRERLKHLGGQLSIFSKPGKGTCVIMTAPRNL